jgi:hypothetical protein
MLPPVLLRPKAYRLGRQEESRQLELSRMAALIEFVSHTP